MQPMRVIVELEADNQNLCGWLTEPDGRRRRFDGWLALASRFAELHGGHQNGGSEGHPTSGSLGEMRSDRGGTE